LADAVATERAVGDAAVDPATDVIAMMSVKSASIAAITESMAGTVSMKSAADEVTMELAVDEVTMELAVGDVYVPPPFL
jgi:hypothetical protein